MQFESLQVPNITKQLDQCTVPISLSHLEDIYRYENSGYSVSKLLLWQLFCAVLNQYIPYLGKGKYVSDTEQNKKHVTASITIT